MKSDRTIVVGEVCIDIIVINPYSKGFLGEYVWPEQIQMQLGGSAFYTSKWIAKLGGDSTIYSIVGPEKDIEKDLHDLRDTGVDLSMLLHSQKETPRSICITGHNIKEFIACSELIEFDFDYNPEQMGKDGIVYIAGYLLYPNFWNSTFCESLHRAKINGMSVIMDTQCWQLKDNAIMSYAFSDDLAGQVDVLLLDRREALLITGAHSISEAGKKLKKMGFSTFIIKMGNDGCLVYQEAETRQVKGKEIEKIVNTIGAGDVFGAALCRYYKTGDLFTVAEKANEIAANYISTLEH